MPQTKKKPTGFCKLCGEYGPLTFEHIPPNRCGNTNSVQVWTLHAALKGNKTPPKFPRGLGAQTICERCNNHTGQTFGPAFARFIQQAIPYSDRIPQGEISPYLPFQIEPLRVIKQISVFVVALAQPYFLKSSNGRALRHSVLNAHLRGNPGSLRFFCYLCPRDSAKFNSEVPAITNLREVYILDCEVALFPMGFCVFSDGRDVDRIANRLALCEITHFFDRAHTDVRSTFLRLRNLRPQGGLPLMFGDPGPRN